MGVACCLESLQFFLSEGLESLYLHRLDSSPLLLKVNWKEIGGCSRNAEGKLWKKDFEQSTSLGFHQVLLRQQPRGTVA